MASIDFRTMGCHARAVLLDEGSEARVALDAIPAWFAERERLLSRFDPRSALARLNADGFARDADPMLWDAIDVAWRAADATGGLVTPTVLGALEAAGYDRTFEDVARDREGSDASAADVPSFRWIERDPATRSIRLPPGLRLDLGGTAKGWSVDAAASWLGRSGPALVDVGGDIAVGGATDDAWPIAIGDPGGGDVPLEIVRLRRGGIATSGRDFRRWTRGGVEQHHVIDPRTGAPARTDVLTATVIACSALEAEIAAKRVLIEGSATGLAWLETRPDLAALVVRKDGEVLRSTRFAHHAWRDAA